MTLDHTRARRLIVAAAALGLVLRLAFGLLYWVDKPLTHDEHEYLALARGMASGKGFVYDEGGDTGTAQQFGRAPGYPAFLAALDAGRPIPTSTPVRVKIAQAFVGAAIVWLIGLLAFNSAGPLAGVLAAGVAAVYPPLVSISAYVLSETLYCAVALATALVLQRALNRERLRPERYLDGLGIVLSSAEGRGEKSPSFERRGAKSRSESEHGWAAAKAPASSADATRRPGAASAEESCQRAGMALVLLAGGLAGAAALIRPAMLFFLPPALTWLLIRRRPALAVAMAAAAVAVITPWTLRNIRAHDRFVLIASEGGVTFWTGNHPLARGEGDLAANPDLKRAELSFRNAHPGLTAEELEPLYYRDALRWIVEHPSQWAALIARKAFYTVVPVGPSYALHSARYRVASVVPYLLLLPFAVAGARRLWLSPHRPIALFLLAGSAILVCLVFFPQERFRIPIIDPVLIVSAAALAGRPHPERPLDKLGVTPSLAEGRGAKSAFAKATAGPRGPASAKATAVRRSFSEGGSSKSAGGSPSEQGGVPGARKLRAGVPVRGWGPASIEK